MKENRHKEARRPVVVRRSCYLRGEQSETDRVQRGEVARGRTGTAHAAHLDTKPHKHATHRARVCPRPRLLHPDITTCTQVNESLGYVLIPYLIT